MLPLEWDMEEPDELGQSVSTDIGQSGAVMFEILVGQHCSFNLLQDWKEPGDLFTSPGRDSLPSTDGLWLGHIIEACWTQGSFTSADELAAAFDKQHIDPRDAGIGSDMEGNALL